MIELLVVMAIIGFLAATLVTVVPLVLDGSRKSGTTTTLERLKSALAQYKGEFGHCPQGVTYTAPGVPMYAVLDQTGTLYCLWRGYGRDTVSPYNWGTFTDMKAPLPGKIKNRQGKLLGFLEEKDLSFEEGDAYKQWPLDAWGRKILYGIWLPAPNTAYDPYCVLTSLGSDENDPADDIIVKGVE